MNWTNFHMHSHYCDGEGELASYVKKAMEKNMYAIGFSSHGERVNWTSRAKHFNQGTIHCCPACTVGPDYERPPAPPAETFRERNAQGASIAGMDWWDLFQDSTLQELIGVALENNRDLRTALARIAEARAVLGFTRADLYPSIDYFLGVVHITKDPVRY